jgi:stearoyl-CoA desaturase (delta-9 desaturase)
MIFSGILDLPWWAYLLIALALTHVTIAAVTIFLHRHQTHRALDLHPAASHFFRFWLWLTTGMVTKEWVAVHRKHHAKVETSEDPHKNACRQEIRRLKQTAATAGGERIDARSARALLRWLRLYTWDWRERRPITLDPLVRKVKLLHTAYTMRQELSELWSRSSASTEQLLRQLRDRLPHLV